MKKINFFLIGMTSVLLAFAMIGCDQGTNTVTEYVNTGGGGGGQQGGGLTDDEQFIIDIATKDTVSVPAGTTINLEKPLTLRPGQTLVVGGAAVSQSVNRLDASAEGPLFAENRPTAGTLNIKATLTLASGSMLLITGGAAVNVIKPSEGQGSASQLYVEKGAVVGVGIDERTGEAETVASTLHVEALASVVFESNALLAVAATPGSVVLEDTTSGLQLAPSAKLAVVTPDRGTDPTSVIGATSVIVVQTGATAVDIAEVDVYTDVNVAYSNAQNETNDNAATGSGTLGDTVANEAGAATAANPEKTTSEGSKVNGLFNPTDAEIAAGAVAATKVTYTGNTALDTVSVPTNAKLIITGEVEDVSNTITLGNGAALEVASGASLDLGDSGTITITPATGGGTAGTVTNNGTINTATDISLVAAAGTGTIVITGEATATGNITLTQNLEIAATDGELILGEYTISPVTKITKNDGTIKTANGTVLAVLLANVEDGTIEVTANAALAASAEVAVGEEVTLEIANGVTLTVNGTLTVDGTIEGDGSITTAGSGKVEVAEGAEFTLSGGTVTGNVTQVVDGDYTLPTGADTSLGDAYIRNLSGITHTAKKSLATTGTGAGIVTIYLTGPVTADHELVATWYGEAGDDKPSTGNYAIATIKGLFTDEVLTNGRTLKNTNESWNWYAGYDNDSNSIISDELLEEAATGDDPHVWLGDGDNPDAFVWYETGTTTDDELTLILWSGATSKQATIEIVPLNADTTLNNAAAYTVIVDWSDLVINPAS